MLLQLGHTNYDVYYIEYNKLWHNVESSAKVSNMFWALVNSKYVNPQLIKLFLGISFLFIGYSVTAYAEVHETISQSYYPVHLIPGKSVLESIAANSPIHEDGNTYSGYTDTHLSWDFSLQLTTEGKCFATLVQTSLIATITIPEQLSTANQQQLEEFNIYRNKLYAHELGHLHIAQQTASKIDTAIERTPAAADCDTITDLANAISNRLLEEGINKSHDYDNVTNHGENQSAWTE